MPGRTANSQMPSSWALAVMAALLVATGANAQGVFKCVDGGKVVFSDKPCSDGQKSNEVRIYKAPPRPEPVKGVLSKEAAEREQARQQYRAKSERTERESTERQRRIDEAGDRVKQIRSDNQDPRKCAEARERMARIERRDPMYKISIDYTMAQQQASLYCGN